MSVRSDVGHHVGEPGPRGISRELRQSRDETTQDIRVVLTGDSIALEDSRGRRAYYAAKRALDVFLAVVGLLLALPILCLVAIAIKIDSPGPVIFKQERLRSRRRDVGKGYWWMIEPFTFYKLRTMTAAADPGLHHSFISAFMEGDEGRIRAFVPSSPGGSYKMDEDPRVTRVGRLLRKLSLDELPQLWNVLIGDMSLVGPRPHLAYEVSMYSGDQLLRLAAHPGITGLSQVEARALAPFETMVDYDLEYIRKRSLLVDLGIIARTIPVVLSRKGAG